MIRLRAIDTINNPDRISSVNVFGGLAIIAVVLFHFNSRLPLAFLGVDVFFLVSGLLIGGIVTRQLDEKRKIRFFEFFLKGGFKILPSYYVFIIGGSLLAHGQACHDMDRGAILKTANLDLK